MARGKKRAKEDDQGLAEQEPQPQRRRPAAAGEVPEDVGGAERPEEAAEDGGAGGRNEGGGDRREVMAEIARRRAAHFAHFKADDEEAEQNAHTGGLEARKLGPWSSAVELIEARAEAAAKRKGRLSDAAKESVGDLAEEAVVWNPARDPKLGSRPPRSVGPLYQACIRLLVDYIEDVESLWGMPDDIKVNMAAAVCQRRKLSPEVAKLFTEGGPDEVVLPECTQLGQQEMIDALVPAATPRLERLEMNLCGRGFGDAAAAALAGAPLPNLRVLRLGGAYRLTDTGLLAVLKQAPKLQELHLPQCSRIDGSSLQQLRRLTPELRVLNLADCRGLSGAALRELLCGGAGLTSIDTLHLDGIGEVDDQLVADICLALPRLTRLSLCFCGLVSDDGVRGVAAGCSRRLLELRLDEVPRVTDAALIALADSCPDLEVLSLQRCHKVTDVGLASVASRGMLRVLLANKVHTLGHLTIKTLTAACSDKLEELDLSWCRGVTDQALGLLVDSSPRLRRLSVFGCSQISETFLHGHSNADLVVVGATGQKLPVQDVVKLKLLEE